MNSIIKNNLYEFYEDIIMSGDANGGMIGKFNYIFHASSVWPNMSYVREDQDSVVSDKDLCDLIDQIKLNKCPPLLIVDELYAEGMVTKQIQNRSFFPAAQWINMSKAITLEKEHTQDAGAFRINIVNDNFTKDLSDWTSVAETVFFKQERINQQLLHSGMERMKFYLLLGRLNDEPVCTSLLYCGTTAGAYMVATLPSHRRLGFSGKMMNAMQKLAKRLGYDLITLQSTNDGLKLYEQLGFKSYGKMILYYYLNF